jgi:ComF family protein
MRKAIHRLKYQHDLGLGEILSQYMVRGYLIQKWQVDLVIPVPLSLDRLAERGYNQASLLAKPFSFTLDLDFRPQALTRVRETRSQVGLSAQERRTNVQEAFLAKPKEVESRKILLIDDVTTTGSTLNACAAALMEAGAAQVYCLTLARAA